MQDLRVLAKLAFCYSTLYVRDKSDILNLYADHLSELDNDTICYLYLFLQNHASANRVDRLEFAPLNSRGLENRIHRSIMSRDRYIQGLFRSYIYSEELDVNHLATLLAHTSYDPNTINTQVSRSISKSYLM